MTSPATRALAVDGVAELAVVERSGLIESRHLGAAAVIGPNGQVLRAIGDTSALVYPRSTLKLLQAIALLRCGVELDGEQLVLAASSHQGTAEHVRVVRELLDLAGLSESDLRCPADWPANAEARVSAKDPLRITMNCSGKHAVFLLACVTNDWPIESYLEPSHPLQIVISATVAEYTNESIEHAGIDGCGAPVLAVTLRGLATAVSRVASATPQSDPNAARLTAAILAHAWGLDTPAVATVINELGIVAKSGAEGVFIAGAVDGTAVALKMLDGSSRASIPVALALLAEAGAVPLERARSVAQSSAERVLGAGLPVGELRSTV